MNTHCGRTLLDHCSHWAILPLPGDMAAGRNSLFQEKIEESAKLGRHRSKAMPASGHFLSFPGERHSPTKPLFGGKLSRPPGHHKQRMHAGLPFTGKSAPEGGTHAQCQANTGITGRQGGTKVAFGRIPHSPGSCAGPLHT